MSSSIEKMLSIFPIGKTKRDPDFLYYHDRWRSRRRIISLSLANMKALTLPASLFGVLTSLFVLPRESQLSAGAPHPLSLLPKKFTSFVLCQSTQILQSCCAASFPGGKRQVLFPLLMPRKALAVEKYNIWTKYSLPFFLYVTLSNCI